MSGKIKDAFFLPAEQSLFCGLIVIRYFSFLLCIVALDCTFTAR